MSRYVDADALMEQMENACMGVMSGCEPFNEPLKVLESAPTSDVVEVVRCKDCKYWHREIHNDIEYFNFSSCELNHYGDGHNFYCSDGERKTGDGEIH